MQKRRWDPGAHTASAVRLTNKGSLESTDYLYPMGHEDTIHTLDSLGLSAYSTCRKYLRSSVIGGY